jgi:hypothetical protein
MMREALPGAKGAVENEEIGDGRGSPLPPTHPGMIQGSAQGPGVMKSLPAGACGNERNGNILRLDHAAREMQQRNRRAAVVFAGVWQHYILLWWA